MALLRLEKVTSHTKELEAIKKLYLRSFPPNERRPFVDMLTDKSGSLEIFAFYDGELFCGFACLLTAQAVSHILYLAIDDSCRSRGYGSKSLAAIHQQKQNCRIIADIERPSRHAANNEQRWRRKAFYLKNGYHETDVKYHWENESYEILVYGGELTEQDFADFWDCFDQHIQENY